MNKILSKIFIISLILASLWLIYDSEGLYYRYSNVEENIIVELPNSYSNNFSNPVLVKGKARWDLLGEEGYLIVSIKDSTGKILGKNVIKPFWYARLFLPLQLLSRNEYFDFKVEVPFVSSTTRTGTINFGDISEEDNGGFYAIFTIPIQFYNQ